LPTLQADEKRGKFRMWIWLHPRDGAGAEWCCARLVPAAVRRQLEALRKYARRKEISALTPLYHSEYQ
jgi:hypothetical protein